MVSKENSVQPAISGNLLQIFQQIQRTGLSKVDDIVGVVPVTAKKADCGDH
jgi:hypothetical protein